MTALIEFLPSYRFIEIFAPQGRINPNLNLTNHCMGTQLSEPTLAAVALMVRFGAADAFLVYFLSLSAPKRVRPSVRPTLNLLRISPTR